MRTLEGIKVHVLCNMHKEYHVSDIILQSAKELTYAVRFRICEDSLISILLLYMTL
jgi:hypothetical protein